MHSSSNSNWFYILIAQLNVVNKVINYQLIDHMVVEEKAISNSNQ